MFDVKQLSLSTFSFSAGFIEMRKYNHFTKELFEL